MKNNKKRLLNFFKNIVISTPSGLPIAGNIYSDIINNMRFDELVSILKDIKNLNEEEKQNITDEFKKLNENIFNDIKNYIENRINKENEVIKIPVIIPCGGKAGCMYPFNSGMPKSQFIIDVKPLIHHIIDSFDRNIFSQIIIFTNRFFRMIEESVKKYGDFVKCEYIDKSVPASLLFIKNEIKSNFLIHYNDVLIDNIKWKEVLSQFKNQKESENIIGMLLCSKYYPMQIGVISEKEPNLVEECIEKPEYLVLVKS